MTMAAAEEGKQCIFTISQRERYMHVKGIKNWSMERSLYQTVTPARYKWCEMVRDYVRDNEQKSLMVTHKEGSIRFPMTNII